MYTLHPDTDQNKIFIINRSQLEGKLEAQYYHPDITKLEEKIRSKTTLKLKDFILKLSSGATPSIAEEEKFYSDNENGIPFLRVQNLQANSKLNIEDVKFINQETHEKYLKRSQVTEGDLLVKITGVGRMAIGSVAPDGFVGNTNQHMAVIKTESKEVSQYLANYLNLDIIEKLATRRATGGTRPALDYTALKSIPIIKNINFTILENAEINKQKKEIQAQKLLKSIDSYLLNELGITLPEKDNSLKNRVFKTSFSQISGIRFDPDYTSKYKHLTSQDGKYEFVPFKDLLIKSPQYGANEKALERNSDNDIRYIRITDIDDMGILKAKGWKTALNTDDRYLLEFNDLLFARSGSVGRCYIHKIDDKPAIFAGYLIRFVLDLKKVNPDYVFYFCNSSIYKFWVSAIERPAVQSNINSEEFKSLPIPLPPLEKQIEIVNYIQLIRNQAKQLQEQALSILDNAKLQVEKIILG